MASSELGHTAGQHIGIQLGVVITQLFLEIIVVIYNGFELVSDLAALLTGAFLRKYSTYSCFSAGVR